LTVDTLTRLTIEIGAFRLDTREAFHGLDKRLARLEWQDTQFAESGVEWRKSLVTRFESLEARIKVFEDHKTRFAWLGWSLLVAGSLGVLKLWLPALKGIL
jgi:hypothetical protein